MLRPVKMYHTSLIFLKADTEKVLDAVNKGGNLHLSLREVGELNGVEYAGEIEALKGRIRDLVSKAKSLLEMDLPSAASSNPIAASDWSDFIKLASLEIQGFEKIVRGVEDATKVEERLKSVLLLWRKATSGPVSPALVEMLSSLRKFKFAFLHSDKSTVSDLRKAVQGQCQVVEASFDPSIALVVYLPSSEAAVMQRCESLGFHRIEAVEEFSQGFSKFAERLSSLEKRVEEISALRQEKLKELRSGLPRLIYLEGAVGDASSILSIKGKSSYQKNWVVLEGYVPKDQFPGLVQQVRSQLNGRLLSFAKEEPTSSNVPVSFKYPKFFKIFDSVTNLYGVPSYNEVNPTPILALSFPILFGLMFGDLGHGISLALLGLIFYKFFGSMKKIGVILMITGLAGAVIGALLYGEVFGQPLHHFVEYEAPLHPSEELMTMLKISLFVGVAHISIGLFLSFANSIIQKKYPSAFLVCLPKLALYLGLMYVVFVYGLNLLTWFSGPIYIIVAPAMFLFLAEPIYEILKHGKKGVGKLGGMFFELFETMISFISNTVSYLRIFAMVVAHIMLTSVFYSLAEITSGGSMGMILSPLLIVAGNVFVVLLEGILVLAQDLRLHFYEWFSKFYNDSGMRFAPFRLAVGVPIGQRR